MKLAVNGCQGRFWIYAGIRRTYLRKDGTLAEAFWGDNNDFWSFKSQQEAQQFLDNWMPQEKQLFIKQIGQAAELGEKTALNFSIEHWKQNVLNVEGAHLGSIFCAVCVRAGIERDKVLGSWRNGRCCPYCIVNNYKVGDVTNCCKEYDNFCNKKTEENAIAMLNKLVLIRNKKYGNVYEEKLMTKEMTVAQVAEKLGYDVKIVKEQVKPEPYQFKAGDVAKHPSAWIDDPFRLIVYANGKLRSYSRKGQAASIGQERFELEGYKKIGELKDFIKDFTN